ncbi:MAG: hypothetical protein Q8Q94_04605 [bacterium]|nr:hypothetical protein [bacterium]MDZ4299822.1 hypothetical protein [Candidatus Sungbacteria bacterium]
MESPERQPMKHEELHMQLREIIMKGDNAHFAGINPDLLKEEDIELYGKLRDETLSTDELVVWKNEIFATEATRAKADTNEPILKDHSDRGNFAAWIANQFAHLQMERMARNEEL